LVIRGDNGRRLEARLTVSGADRCRGLLRIEL
jgi:hypothetical protein